MCVPHDCHFCSIWYAWPCTALNLDWMVAMSSSVISRTAASAAVLSHHQYIENRQLYEQVTMDLLDSQMSPAGNRETWVNTNAVEVESTYWLYHVRNLLMPLHLSVSYYFLTASCTRYQCGTKNCQLTALVFVSFVRVEVSERTINSR